jgi:hypothetical protein
VFEDKALADRAVAAVEKVVHHEDNPPLVDEKHQNDLITNQEVENAQSRKLA